MKTTIVGILAAGALVLQAHVQAGKDLTDWKTWLPAVFVAMLGYLVDDAKKRP